jgi:hypothetical protein
MPQSDPFGEIFVQTQGLGNGAGNLRNLKRMGETRAIVIAVRRQENLRLMLETAKGFAVDDAVSIPLESRA